MSRASQLAVAGLVVLIVGMAALWLLRFRVADAAADRWLARSGVPATYRLTRIGPFRERIEDLRIGPADAPDLVARRVDLILGYTAGGPVLRAIRAEHVRVRGRVGDNGLSLGALDRLLPRSSGEGRALPDLDLRLRDARLVLATPVGVVTAALEGAGNPQTLFRGRAEVTAATLRVASCAMGTVQASLAVAARGGAPGASGSVRVGHIACPGVALGNGAARLTLRSDAFLRHPAIRAEPTGFGGTAAGTRFAGTGGVVEATGDTAAMDVAVRLTLAAMSAPRDLRARLAARPALEGTPFGPTVARGQQAVADLLARADADVAATLRISGRTMEGSLQRLAIMGHDGATLVVSEYGGILWTGQGWRVDADLVARGGALPPVDLRLRQRAPGAPIEGVAELQPYRAGGAQLAVPPMGFTWTGGRVNFDGRVRADGPIGSGFVRGLDLPVWGQAEAGGAFSMGRGCRTAAARSLRLGSLSFADLRLPLCGGPIIARDRAGGFHVDMSSGPVLVRGRTESGSAVTLGAAVTRLSERGFAIAGLTGALGDGPLPTWLTAATLTGTWGTAGPSGTFAGASARIGAVPLTLSDANGTWRSDGGALSLAGDVRVADTAGTPRFRPLAASGAVLTLSGGALHANAVLREPTSRAAIAGVDIVHDLGRAAGHAVITADALRFVPKGLQPDALTPLTLGVIANVSGVVSGQGRIDWTANGVSSSGTFGTERLDLAAAFGPVAGLSGRIRFTDLLNLVSAPHQLATVAEINPGVPITGGVVRFALPGQNRVEVEGARWPFAGGTLRLDPTMLDFGTDAERQLTFRVDALDAAAFVQQLDFPNISATGTFDGVLPMVFGQTGGSIIAGSLAARPAGGTIAYVGELTTARLGTMGKLAFDALKAIRYSTLTISLDGRLDGEMVSRVQFTGVRQATPDRNIAARLIRNLPFRFNIGVRAPFRGLVGTARTYYDPQLLLQTSGATAIQPAASPAVR